MREKVLRALIPDIYLIPNFRYYLNMKSSTGLTNLQQELLKLYSFELPAQELKELKDTLARFFADKAAKEADKVWEKKGLSNDVMDQWLNESK